MAQHPPHPPFRTPAHGGRATTEPPESAEMDYFGDEGRDEATSDSAIARVKQAHESELMAIEGVLGVGIEQGDLGEPQIVVYVRDAAVAAQVPDSLEGQPVRAVVTGEIEPY